MKGARLASLVALDNPPRCTLFILFATVRHSNPMTTRPTWLAQLVFPAARTCTGRHLTESYPKESANALVPKGANMALGTRTLRSWLLALLGARSSERNKGHPGRLTSRVLFWTRMAPAQGCLCVSKKDKRSLYQFIPSASALLALQLRLPKM